MLTCAGSPNSARKSRYRKTLRHNLEKKLLSYTAAAGAVCMAGLFPHPATAEVVYTPADIVTKNALGTLDIDGDGIADFQFIHFTYFHCGHPCSTSAFFYNSFALTGLQTTNNVVQHGIRSFSMAKLPAKTVVGSNDTFIHQGRILLSAGAVGSQWVPPARGYVGLRFMISGEVHYGWLRLTIDSAAGTVIIGGYAYETVPNKPIVVNRRPGGSAQDLLIPGSLGSLAAGAQGAPPEQK